jgi:antirestriction protein ArdC
MTPADNSTEAPRGIPFMRYYNVFNVAQCDLPARCVPVIEADRRNRFERIEAAESIVSGMPQAPAIRHGFDCACYSPIADEVRLPNMPAFDTSEAYYATAFHELGHATGHASRLNRKGIATPTLFGTDSYGREELVAEMTAAFLCGTAGIETATIDNAGSYIAGWLRAIREDVKLVVSAAAQAQKAADFILGRTWAEQPATADVVAADLAAI